MLPADYAQLKQQFNESGRSTRTFIVKPSRGSQGKGIVLTRSLDDINPSDENIVQQYLAKPHLLGGYKYDLRLYVLLTSVQPVRMFIFREGLVRLCTRKYTSPTSSNMHLAHMQCAATARTHSCCRQNPRPPAACRGTPRPPTDVSLPARQPHQLFAQQALGRFCAARRAGRRGLT